MDRAERRLEQPAALVLLAEARWRAGDDDGHDEAAHRALAVAEWMGSLGPLVTALGDAPDVLARCIDAGGAREGDWRALARAGDASFASSDTDRARIVIGTLGRLRVAVDGTERDVNPSRAIDIAAEVARAGWRGVPRADLVELLAEHSVDAQNYLRQVVHRLRRIAPEGVELTSDDGLLRWTPAGAVVTEDDVLRSLLAQVARETGETRLRTLATALDLAERGVLVSAADSLAADELRAEIDAAVAEARREHARLLLEAGRATEAVASARAAVAAEPLREDGWCLLMRAAAAADGPSAAVPVYAECAAALAEIGLGPSAGTRDLLRRLREAGAGRVTAPA
jgi:DNA-binding SARP family transcriptional activator